MNKNFFLTLTALAVMTTIGYAAYTNGSIGDLSRVVNNQIGEVVSGSSNYLGAVMSTQSLTTSTTTVAGTRERNLPGIVKILPIDPKTLNVDSQVGVPIFKFQITARKNNDDVIKYIDFEVRGAGPYKKGYYSSGVLLDYETVLASDNAGETGSGVIRVISMGKDRMVLRYGRDPYTQDVLKISQGHASSYVLKSVLIRANEKTSLSVKILKVAR